MDLSKQQRENLENMVIADALSEVMFTASINTKLALQGKISSEERRKRQDESFGEAFKSIREMLDSAKGGTNPSK